MATYPATNTVQASELLVDVSNQMHEIVNEDAVTEVTTESGPVPSVRKALADTFLFVEPVAWDSGNNETAFNQLRTFGDETYWAPTATLTNPIAMGATPVGDNNWRLAPTGKNSSIVQQWDTAAQEELLPTGSKIYPEISTLSNGDTVPSGTTHLRVLASGKPTIVAMSPVASGVISALTERSATIGVAEVNFYTINCTSTNSNAINVKNLGAKGDGVTDDTDALQAAFDLGGRIYIPKGDYRFTQLLIKQPTNFIYGDGHGSSLLRPIPITHDTSSATVPNRAGFIVKEQETLALRGLTFEDIGFIGYRDGVSVIDGLVDFVRIVTAVGTEDRDISMNRCRFIDPLRDGLGCSVRSNLAGDAYGSMDGVRMTNCIGDVTNFNNHLQPISNMFRTMIEFITFEHTKDYGYYPISNCYSESNYCHFWRTLTDFKRGTKQFVCSNNVTLDMTDVDHSTDGSKYGIFSNNVGRISNKAVDTGRFIEIQGEDIQVNGGIYDSNGLDSGGGVMVQQYPYPSEGSIGVVGHQSKRITIKGLEIRNEQNHAVRIIDAEDVIVSDVTGIDCLWETVFFTQTANTEDLDNPGNQIKGSNAFASDIKSIRCRNAIGASSDYPVSIDKCVDEKGRQSFGWGTPFIDQDTHEMNGLDRYSILNSNPDLRMNEAATLVPGYTIPATGLTVTVVDAPVGASTAIEINDTNASSVKTLACDDKFKYLGEENIYLRAIVRKVTAPTCGFVIRYYDATGTQLSNSFVSFLILSTEWKDLAVQVQIPDIANCAYFKVELAAASESNSPSNVGSSQWANFRVSRDLPFGKK